MLQVPPIRQPDNVTCLPTCVRAVLAYQGCAISDEEAAALCGTQPAGSAVQCALDSLAVAGIDADLRQLSGIAELRELLEDDRPAIALLRHPAGGYHAVVVCDVSDRSVTVMDPAPGEYLTIPLSRFEALWYPRHSEAILVGTRPA